MQLLKKIQKVESHTKFEDLKTHWLEKQRLHEMVSVVSKKRLNSLVRSNDSYYNQSPMKPLNFSNRKMSMSPSGDHLHQLRKELDESGMTNAELQNRTFAEQFNTTSLINEAAIEHS